MNIRHAFAVILLVLCPSLLWAYEQRSYQPAKVVYDLSTNNEKGIEQIFDRVSMLQSLYDNNSFEASIVVVVHDAAIPFFAIRNFSINKALRQRAESLVMGEIIQFRLCQASARMQGFAEKDFPDFVRMVPMADAELVKLQHQGYAYLR